MLFRSLTDVLATAHDVRNGLPGNHAVFTKRDDGTLPIWQVVRASSSAPGYFPMYHFNDGIYLDGCITSKNPTIRALSYATEQFGSTDNLNFLSLGTGFEHGVSVSDHCTDHPFCPSISEDPVHHSILSNKSDSGYQYIRFNPLLIDKDETPLSLPMDNVSPENIKALLDLSDRYIEVLDEEDRINHVCRRLDPEFG